MLARLATLCAAAGFLSTSGEADAYLPWTTNGAQILWRAGSPATSWDDATKTLTYRLNTLNFPAGNLPSIAQAGAALHNAFQSIEDIAGASIRFRRGVNAAASPMLGDGQVHVYFHTSAGLDPYGSDISTFFGLTYPQYDAATGTILDMDIFFNGLASAFTWSTVAPAPPIGSNDIEVTLIHEALHAIGLLHPVYFYSAAWPVGRVPELVLPDRCYAPDDRAGVRFLYPEAPLLGRITGTVQAGGVDADGAIVVATDAAGIPQATIHTLGDGTFDLRVPAGTYDVTAHHLFNSTYVGFGGAEPFRSASTASGVAVAAGLTTPGVALTCVAGAPSMKLTRIGTPGNLTTQVQFLAPGTSGTLQLAVRSSPSATFTALDVASVDLGPDVAATLGLVAALDVNTTAVNLDYTVAPGAAPGPRNLRLTRTSGERLFLPAYHAVAGAGALSVAAGPANPAAADVLTGTLDHPVLQVRLTAAAEHVRVRRLAFDVAGSGPALPNVRLWRDVDADGLGDARILTSAAFALAVPEDQTLATATFDDIGVTVPAGTSIDLVLTFDLPAAGAGDYTASLTAAGFGDQAHGMFYADVLVPTGSATGGTQTLGSVAVSALGQVEGVVAIPAGGTTTQASLVLRGTATTTQGMTGLDVELRPLGTPFSNTPTHSSATTFPSGAAIDVTAGGLVSGTSYHWQARPVSSSLGAGGWTSFGGNAETAPDFSRDTSVTTLGAPLQQLDAGLTLLPSGGLTRSTAYFRAPVASSAGFPVALEVEIVPAGQPFADAATVASPLVASGSTAQASFTGTVSGDFRWQARAVGQFGAASAWTDSLLVFHLNAGETIEADGGCAASASSAAVPLLIALLAAPLLRRRKGGAAALLLLASTPAWGDEEPVTLGASAGALFLDASFETLGTDLTLREIDGTGLGAVDVEALVAIGADLRLGLAAEAAAGGDLLLFGAGPLLAWNLGDGHSLRVGALIQALDVRESGFGDFQPAFVPRGGYEYRWGWARFGAEVRWSRFSYDEDVVDGDDTLGGAGVLVYVGVDFSP
ncbi:MAG TPA: hypothetical protein VF950_07620 [Planctomycetota bacterium]